MDMDNEKLIKILMMSPSRRRVVSEMAASIIATLSAVLSPAGL